ADLSGPDEHDVLPGPRQALLQHALDADAPRQEEHDRRRAPDDAEHREKAPQSLGAERAESLQQRLAEVHRLGLSAPRVARRCAMQWTAAVVLDPPVTDRDRALDLVGDPR